jgi:hypothetical protein
MATPFYTIEQIKYANRERGQHFFSRGALRFSRSRISSKVHRGPGGIFFTTSEQFDERSPRLYTVSRFDPASGAVDTAGNFQEHATARHAHAEAARLAALPQ